MNELSQKFAKWLFETNAVRVCAEKEPFWYTSGTIGPYYINTHFLYGNETKATEMLDVIDKVKVNILSCPSILLEKEMNNYNEDNIFKGVIDELCIYIEKNIGIENIDCISGGERRDWFFSLIIAEILKIPHITVYKDSITVLTEKGETTQINKLEGKKILHIVDLVTEASSYERVWIPAIKNLGSEIKWSLSVVDRKQGGEKVFEKANIEAHTMVSIDESLFREAFLQELISIEQNKMIEEYINNPKQAMRNFLINNPQFIEKSLSEDEKTRSRVKLLLEKDIYNLKGVMGDIFE